MSRPPPTARNLPALVPARRLAAVLALTAAATAATWAQPALPDAELYTAHPQLTGLVVSPSNTHAAVLVPNRDGRQALAVIDLADPSQVRALDGYRDVDIVSVHWVNDRRLVYELRGTGPVVAYDKWGTFAIDRDGSERRQLVSARSDGESPIGSRIASRVLPRGWLVGRAIGDGSDDVLVFRVQETLSHGRQARALARLDTRNVRHRMLSEGQPEGAAGWLLDHNGEPRVVTAVVRDRWQLWWRPPSGGAWDLLMEHPLYQGEGFDPVALEGDGTLILRGAEGRDTRALYAYDPAARKLDPEPIFGVDGFDVGGVVYDRGQRQVIGARVRTDRLQSLWFDDALAQVQATVDKALPAGRSNHLLCGRCVGATRFVVHSSSDRQPGEYHLFDKASGALRWLGAARPWIDEARQGRRSFHRVAARDGLSLPVVVTHPPGAADDRPLPTVLLVHGGPWVRGTDLGWSAEPQFLASRGWRVVEVDFRGSTGLGWKHFRAGWGEWGLAMQDDLVDTLDWAVREKLSDPNRVCIYGASYGGYAALMGPARHPGRYRCAVSHVGVTDITLLYSGNWTDMPAAFRTWGLTSLVGDLERDAERLRQTSPLHRVADIKVPVLLVQGRLDERVAPVHADRFVAAARAASVPIERVDYEEPHGWTRPSVHAQFLRRLEAFFATHLGTGPN